MPRRYRHTATVETHGAFPVDMLRYDACHPATETDAYDIARSVREHEPVTARVERIDDDRMGRWTDARWRSFAAQIVAVETYPA
jgi:hypothetical protein